MKKTVESALFLAGRHLGLHEISRISNSSDHNEIRNIINEIRQEYDERDSPITIVEEAGKFKMDLRSEYLLKVKDLAPQMDMNRALLQTLSFIAYKQPIKQSKMVDKFGNRTYDYVKELEQRGLIVAERKGHTKLLQTSPKLMSYLGEEDITQLKESIKIRKAELQAEEFDKQQMKSREEELKKGKRRKAKGTKVEFQRELDFEDWVDKAHKDKQDKKLDVMEQFENETDDDSDDEEFEP